jgi:SSS family solute:Na+ symporter
MTQEPVYEKISGLTYGTLSEEDRKTTQASWSKGDVFASVLLLVFIVLAYLFFTG